MHNILFKASCCNLHTRNIFIVTLWVLEVVQRGVQKPKICFAVVDTGAKSTAQLRLCNVHVHCAPLVRATGDITPKLKLTSVSPYLSYANT